MTRWFSNIRVESDMPEALGDGPDVSMSIAASSRGKDEDRESELRVVSTLNFVELGRVVFGRDNVVEPGENPGGGAVSRSVPKLDRFRGVLVQICVDPPE